MKKYQLLLSTFALITVTSPGCAQIPDSLLDSHPLNQHLKPSVANRRPLDRKAQLANLCEQLLQGLITVSLR